MLSQIIQLIIIVVFLLLSGHYLFVNSLRKRTLRKDSLKAAGAALYFLPVFMQGLFLLYAGVLYCFFLTRDFYNLIQEIFSFGISRPHDFSGLLIIFPGALLMGISCWLAKISLDKNWSLKLIGYKIIYAGWSVLILVMIGYNLDTLFNAGFFPTNDVAVFDIGLPFILFIVGTLVIIVTVFTSRQTRFITYLKIPLFTVSFYAAFCFIVALVCFCLFNFVRLLHF